MSLKQEVFMTVHDSAEGGNVVLDPTGLRIDFDIRLIPKFNRATFTIYNLTEATVKSLVDGGRYVTLKTRLHNGEIYTLANRFFVSNAVDELKLPERITTLYCFDNLKKTLLERQVNYTAHDTSLEGMMKKLTGNVSVDYKSFPIGLTSERGLLETRPLQGTVRECISGLEKEFKFTTFTDNGGLLAMYLPDLKNVAVTSLVDKKSEVTLHTTAMRSNPKIGIANATIHSNLDGRIKPTSVLDLSKLLTIGSDSDERTLQLVDKYLKNYSSFSKYQAFAVNHTGSTHTSDWSTKVSALSPTKGKLMSTVTWAQIK